MSVKGAFKNVIIQQCWKTKLALGQYMRIKDSLTMLSDVKNEKRIH